MPGTIQLSRSDAWIYRPEVDIPVVHPPDLAAEGINVEPTYWAVDGLVAMPWQGMPLRAALLLVAALLALTLLFSGEALTCYQ